ncbi:MAG: SLBB domain-containing protein [Leptospiraceae bacterium]|nr:SLBB domain-containing protein [Leptospiraceae bacterium]
MLVTWAYFKDRREELKRIYSPKRLTVKVQGSVKEPGVYEMPEGSVVRELVQKAGGLLSDETGLTNLEEEIQDGQVITIGK